MKRTLKNLIVIAIGTLCCSQSYASLATNTWQNFTGSSPFSANTLGYMTTATVTGGTATSTGGNSGSYLNSGSSSTLVFSLTPITLTPGQSISLDSLNFDYKRSNNGQSAQNITWDYSISGGSYQSLTTTKLNKNTTWNTGVVVSLASIVLQNSGQTVTIRGSLDSTSSSVGFDNLQIIASSTIVPVPEPTTSALLALGLVFIAGKAGQSFVRRRSQRAAK